MESTVNGQGAAGAVDVALYNELLRSITETVGAQMHDRNGEPLLWTAGPILAGVVGVLERRARMMAAPPGFWPNETTGVLRPAVEAYLVGKDLDQAQCAALRAYLRQWMTPYTGQEVEALTDRVDTLTDRAAISRWLHDALELGIDPL
jgi:hypothetical protein